MDHEHPDLKGNYVSIPHTTKPQFAAGSFDFVSNTTDPKPKDAHDTHGTPCAGLVGATAGDVCGVGVAPQVKLSGKVTLAC